MPGIVAANGIANFDRWDSSDADEPGVGFAGGRGCLSNIALSQRQPTSVKLESPQIRSSNGEGIRRRNPVRLMKPQVASGPGAFFECVAATLIPPGQSLINGPRADRESTREKRPPS
jgi:hypothetical protein